MTLLEPLQLLWLGLLAPLTALYILKRRRQRRRVPSTLLWEAALRDMRAERPWKRLLPHASFILQVLLIIAGAVLAGVGLVGNGLLIGGLVSANNAVDTFETDPELRAAARDDISRGNTIGIIGGVVGGAFTVAGAVLITLGVRRRQSNVSPMVDQGAMGVMWSGRF